MKKRNVPNASSAYLFAESMVRLATLHVRIRSSNFYSWYSRWCGENGYDTASESLFWRALQDHFGGRIEKKLARNVAGDGSLKMFVFNLAPKGSDHDLT